MVGVSYDDALDYHAAVTNAMGRWGQAIAVEAENMLQRGDLTGLTRTGVFHPQGLELLLNNGRPRPKPRFRAFGDGVAHTMQDLASRATTVYVSPRTIQRVDEVAGDTIPDIEHVAVPLAVARLSEPVTVSPDSDPVDIDGLLWAPTDLLPDTNIRARKDPDAKRSIIVALNHMDGFIRHHPNGAEEARRVHQMFWASSYGYDSIGQLRHGADLVGSHTSEAFQLASAIWRMTARTEGRVTAVSASAGPRKAARRQGLDSSSVTVVHLNSETERLGLDHSGRRASRRHDVRGHYRRQPYGPRGQGLWRWTYIDEHERGEGPKLDTSTVTKV